VRATSRLRAAHTAHRPPPRVARALSPRVALRLPQVSFSPRRPAPRPSHRRHSSRVAARLAPPSTGAASSRVASPGARLGRRATPHRPPATPDHDLATEAGSHARV